MAEKMTEAKFAAAKFQLAPRMPTPEEHREVSLAWLARVQPTLIDQWPRDLAVLSMPTDMIKVDVPAMWDGLCALHDNREPVAYLFDLATELDAKLGWRRKFFKLNSRSPKDAPWPFETPVTMSGKEAVSVLTASMRIMDDLMEFRWVPEQPAYVCLREQVYWIRPQNEYRCFVKDGHLIAVSHYDYVAHPWTGPEDGGKSTRAMIDAWFAKKLKPVLHIDTVVFDLAIRHDGEMMLIEINPYGGSDPCHFGSYEAVENATSYIEFVSPTRSALASTGGTDD